MKKLDLLYESIMNDLVYTAAEQFKLKTGPKIQYGLLSKTDVETIIGRYLNLYGRMFPNIFVYTKYPAYNTTIHTMKDFNDLCNNEKIYDGTGKIQVKFEISGVDFISKRPSARLSISFPEGHKIF